MALTPTEIEALVATVAGADKRHRAWAESRPPRTSKTTLRQRPLKLCNGLAPGAPESILREASIQPRRMAIRSSRPHLSAGIFRRPHPAPKFDMTFNNSAATANGLQGERRWRVAVKICRAAWRRDFEGRRVGGRLNICGLLIRAKSGKPLSADTLKP